MKQALLFPGQGSQYVGMGKELNGNFTAAQRVFEEGNDILCFDIRKLCFEGPEDELKITSNTQPAILTVSVACWHVLRESGVTPSAVAGHSLGEYSALVAAKAFSFPDALRLVQKRGRLMQESSVRSGGMAAILGLDRELVQKACQEAGVHGVVEVANYNCPGQIVIAGEAKALQKAMDLAREYGAKKAIPLQVSGPFHSSLMAEAGQKLALELDPININDPACPLVSNVTAEIVQTADPIKNLLVKQVSSSVRWDDSVNRLAAMGINTFVETGPGKVLAGLGRKIIRDARFFNVEDKASLENTLDNLKEVL
ncbi:MAG: ACP S-malonyltransferase [Eubacteriales bacterium]